MHFAAVHMSAFGRSGHGAVSPTLSAFGAKRTCRDGGNDVNDPNRSLAGHVCWAAQPSLVQQYSTIGFGDAGAAGGERGGIQSFTPVVTAPHSAKKVDAD